MPDHDVQVPLTLVAYGRLLETRGPAERSADAARVLQLDVEAAARQVLGSF